MNQSIINERSTMKILVGSKNPVKVAATKAAFEKYFEAVYVEGISVPSDVPDQPINEETLQGAKNRALALYDLNQKEDHQANYFVGVEGGIVQLNNIWFGFGGMCIVDQHKHIGFGNSPMFQLPDSIVESLLQRKELGTVIDELSGEQNTKHKGGAVGFLTRDVLDRKNLYVQGLVVALIPFVNPQMYFAN